MVKNKRGEDARLSSQLTARSRRLCGGPHAEPCPRGPSGHGGSFFTVDPPGGSVACYPGHLVVEPNSDASAAPEDTPSTGFLPITLAVALFVTGLFVLGIVPGFTCGEAPATER